MQRCKLLGHDWRSSTFDEWAEGGWNFVCKRCDTKVRRELETRRSPMALLKRLFGEGGG